jgi:hypothetical protein
MNIINTYLYSNLVEVQIIDTSIFKVRNRTMYARPVVIYQGIDNPIQVIIKNQDQKPVNLTGYSVQVDIQDPVNRVTASSFAINFSDITQGRGTFVIKKDVVDGLGLRLYKLTFRTNKNVDNQEQPLYIDDNYGVPLDLYIKPAYYSDMSGSTQAADTVLIDGGTI